MNLPKTILTTTCCLIITLAGCGLFATQRTEFPDQLKNADGEPIFVEDVQDIVQDPNLTDDARRNALNNLGIDNEEFVDAIVDAGLDGTPPATDGDNTGDDDGSGDGDGTDGDGTTDGDGG